MPAPGATPVTDYDALDLGRDAQGRWLIGTRYSDGSYVVWDANTEQEVAYINPGRPDPADLGGGRAAVINPDGSLTAFDIANPPPQLQGAPPAAGPAAPGAPVNPRAPTGPVGTGRPGEDFNYGPTRPGTGRYPGAMPGQTVPGRPTDVPFGSTVAPSTWNAADPTQGRGAGWGTIGAGTEGQPYGWGVPGFNQAPIKINEADLPYLFDPKLAPGYIPGSGTYNQFALNTQDQTPRFPGAPQGLFQKIGNEVVNSRYGLGGTGDPTTGAEVQTPQRWITGKATDGTQALQGDARWRREHGLGGGGGGFDPALAAAAPPYAYAPTGGGGGGMGGGFFGSTVTSNWGQTPETAGKDYLATLFLRSDTPTGIGTPAWSAPPAMWQGLLDEIRAGRIFVQDPQAWQMIQEKTGLTQQQIGGAALGGRNVQPGGAPGTGSSTEDAIANKNAADAADRAAYWAYQQALLRQGDTRIALEEARDAWSKAYQTAGLTGQFGGADTQSMQQQRFAQGVSEAGLTGMYNGQKTQQAIAQENAQAQYLLSLQASMKGPRDYARYQSTFGATPQGLQDVLAAYQGRYQLPTGQGAQGQAQGGRASAAGLAGDILSGTYGQDPAAQQTLGNPRQADLSNWARMQPSQREMILGQYEDQGWDANDVENLMKGAAPRAAGASSASYNFFQR
jgi:hypothetical protein